MPDSSRLSRVTVTAVFLALGLATGTWAARIPAIKGGLHLSAGVLGLTLLGPAVGSVLAMPAAGAANDWSAVYLHSSLGAPLGLAAVGYTVFSATMTAGRIAVDRLSDRLGPARLVRLSAGVAAVSFGVALLAGQIWSAMAGFAVLGAGLSVVVPLVFTAASRLGRAGPNLALVTSAGYLGMLAGPAIIGGLAEAVGLPAALATIVVLSGLIAVLGHVVLPRTAAPAAPPPPGEILVTRPGG